MRYDQTKSERASGKKAPICSQVEFSIARMQGRNRAMPKQTKFCPLVMGNCATDLSKIKFGQLVKKTARGA